MALRILGRENDCDTISELSAIGESTCNNIFRKFVVNFGKHHLESYVNFPEGNELKRVMEVYRHRFYYFFRCNFFCFKFLELSFFFFKFLARVLFLSKRWSCFQVLVFWKTGFLIRGYSLPLTHTMNYLCIYWVMWFLML